MAHTSQMDHVMNDGSYLTNGPCYEWWLIPHQWTMVWMMAHTSPMDHGMNDGSYLADGPWTMLWMMADTSPMDHGINDGSYLADVFFYNDRVNTTSIQLITVLNISENNEQRVLTILNCFLFMRIFQFCNGLKNIYSPLRTQLKHVIWWYESWCYTLYLV